MTSDSAGFAQSDYMNVHVAQQDESEAYLVTGQGVDHARPLLHVKRRLVALALQRRHARDRLHDRVVDPAVGVGTGGADAVDRAEDYPRVDSEGSRCGVSGHERPKERRRDRVNGGG